MVTHGPRQPPPSPEPGRHAERGVSAVDPAAQTTAPAELPARVAVVRMPLAEFAKRTAVAAGIVTVAAALILLVWVGASLLALLFAGVLLAVMLRGLADLVARQTGLGPGWSLGVVILGLVGLAAAAGWRVAPAIAQQVGELSDALPRSVDELERWLSQYRFGEWLVENTPGLGAMMPRTGSIVDRVTGIVGGALGALISVLVVLFVGVYLAAAPGIYKRGVVKLVTPRHRPKVESLLCKLYETLKWWLVGKAITMAAVGLVTGIGLWAVGLENYLTLGVFAGLMDFVPNFGPYIGAAPAVLLALPQGAETVGWVVAVFVLAQSLEGYVLTPIVQQRTVNMPPALTIAAQLVLGVLLGGIGVIIAAPATAAALVIVNELYVKETLGDRSEEQKGAEGEGKREGDGG